MLLPVRTVAPTETPVSLAEAKLQVHAEDFADDDASLTGYIEAATSLLDGYAGILKGRALVTQTWRQDFPWFCRGALQLPLAPVQSIAAITYRDGDDVEQTLSPSVYAGPYHDSAGAFVARRAGQAWPSTYDRPDAVSVTFVAGYGAAAAVPRAIRQAILLLVAHWYENREAATAGSSTELPFGVPNLIRPFRRLSV